MGGVIQSLQRSVATLGRGRVWLYMLAPAIVALVIMIGLAFFALDQLVAVFIEQPPMTWITAWGALWLANLLAALGGWLVLLSASYLIAIVLTAVVVMPLLLNHLADADYADLARMGKDSLVAASWNSVWAAVLFIIGWLLTLPLWLIPGFGLVLPFFWMAWLNRRTFAYDALSVHATDAEWGELRRQLSTPLLALGFVMALLTLVPFVGLFAPSLAALAYIHYCLEALRRLRQGSVVSVIQKQEGRA